MTDTPMGPAAPKRTARRAQAAPTANGEAAQIAPLQALLGIIIRPLATFQKLRESKHGYFWLVFAVAVVAIIVFASASASVQTRTFQISTPPAGAQTGANNGAATRQFQAPSPVLTIGLAVVAALAVTVLDYGLRGLIAFGAGMILGGAITFKEAFRMGVWTTIPYSIRRIVQALAVALTGGQAAAGLSAALTTAEIRAMPLLNTLLGTFDFYAVWSILLLAIGTAVTARIGPGKALVATVFYVGLSLVGTLIFFAVSSAVGGLFGGGVRAPGGGGVRPPGG